MLQRVIQIPPYNLAEQFEILNDGYSFLESQERKEGHRGGWYTELEYGGHKNSEAQYFHYIESKGECLNTFTQELPEKLANLFKGYVEVCVATWSQKQAIHNLEIGEVCIRVIYYDSCSPDLKWEYFNPHTDYDLLSVPLYSNRGSLGHSFYGEMVERHKIQELRNLEAFPHYFRMFDVPRIYVVGFMQLPFDHVDDFGGVYREQLHALIQEETGIKKSY